MPEERINILGGSPAAVERMGAFYDAQFPQHTITESTTLDPSQHATIWLDSSSGDDIDATLPSASIVLCREFTLKKVNPGGGVCRAMGSIDDLLNPILDDFMSITVKSIGSQWMIVSSHRFTDF